MKKNSIRQNNLKKHESTPNPVFEKKHRKKVIELVRERNKRAGTFYSEDALFYEILEVLLSNKRLCEQPQSLEKICEQAGRIYTLLRLTKYSGVSIQAITEIEELLNYHRFCREHGLDPQ